MASEGDVEVALTRRCAPCVSEEVRCGISGPASGRRPALLVDWAENRRCAANSGGFTLSRSVPLTSTGGGNIGENAETRGCSSAPFCSKARGDVWCGGEVCDVPGLLAPSVSLIWGEPEATESVSSLRWLLVRARRAVTPSRRPTELALFWREKNICPLRGVRGVLTENVGGPDWLERSKGVTGVDTAFSAPPSRP